MIDPIGSVPVFIAVTRRYKREDRPNIALHAILMSTGVLLFFLVAGQMVLEAMEVPLDAFQVAGGIVLFLFALSMIFGESKPEQEVAMSRHYRETAVFPLAVPCIASPGAMMAVVLLTDNHRFSIPYQMATAKILLGVLLITYLLLLCANSIPRRIRDGGANILSRGMGMFLGSVASRNVLEALKDCFLA